MLQIRRTYGLFWSRRRMVVGRSRRARHGIEITGPGCRAAQPRADHGAGDCEQPGGEVGAAEKMSEAGGCVGELLML